MESLHWRFLPRPYQRMFLKGLSYQRKTYQFITRQRTIRKASIPVIRIYKTQKEKVHAVSSYIQGELTTTFLVMSLGDDPAMYMMCSNLSPTFSLRYLFQQLIRDFYIQQVFQQIHIPNFISIHLLQHLVYLFHRIP